MRRISARDQYVLRIFQFGGLYQRNIHPTWISDLQSVRGCSIRWFLDRNTPEHWEIFSRLVGNGPYSINIFVSIDIPPVRVTEKYGINLTAFYAPSFLQLSG